MIFIIIKVNVFDTHKIETSRRHIGVTTEDNANTFIFNIPSSISERNTDGLNKEVIFVNSTGSYVFPISELRFNIPQILTTDRYFFMQVHLFADGFSWKTFPERYELVRSLDDSNESPASIQRENDLNSLKESFNFYFGSLSNTGYDDLSWEEILGSPEERYDGVVWEFTELIDDIYKSITSLSSLEPSGEKLFDMALGIGHKTNAIKSSIVDVINDIIPVEDQRPLPLWSDVMDQLSSLPQSVSNQISEGIEDAKATFIEGIKELIDEVAEEFEIELEFPSELIFDFEDVKYAINTLCVQVYNNGSGTVSPETTSVKFKMSNGDGDSYNVEYTIVNGQPCFLVESGGESDE